MSAYAMSRTTAAGRWNERGFTMLEIMIVVALIGTVMSMAIMAGPAFRRTAQADSGLAQALDLVRSARDIAISQRRNVELRFINNNGLQIARVDIGANGVQTGTTVLRTIELENRMELLLQTGVPDTPMLFGNQTATDFGTTPRRMFTSEGTFVDANGDVLNGTMFLSVPGDRNSARAITILGATALIRAWKWNGREWVE
jgi:prepilin-type N-terminal cleavage/methylation domain-containing protein